MVLNSRRVRRAAVRTKAGIYHGKLSSLDFDVDTGKLCAIRVLPRGAVVELLAHELVIGWRSIISIDEKEVVVEDGCATGTVLRLARVEES